MPMSPQTPSVLVTGGTGFIGERLVARLLQLGTPVIVLTRQKLPATAAADEQLRYIQSLSSIDSQESIRAVINLAGEPLAAGRWNAARKRTFIDSRVQVTRAIYDLIERLQTKPQVLVNGSAIGWYGPNGNEELSEDAPSSQCYSQELCNAWEQEANRVSALGVRVCLLRIGIVLGPNGGPLTELRKSAIFKCAAQLGNGRQWMSWIHLDDLVNISLYLLDNGQINGPVNGTAPNPVRNSEFTSVLGQQLKTWVRISVPALFLNLAVGEMAEEVLLTGQRVIPRKLLDHDFEFTYPDIGPALQQILGPADAN